MQPFPGYTRLPMLPTTQVLPLTIILIDGLRRVIALRTDRKSSFFEADLGKPFQLAGLAFVATVSSFSRRRTYCGLADGLIWGHLQARLENI